MLLKCKFIIVRTNLISSELITAKAQFLFRMPPPLFFFFLRFGNIANLFLIRCLGFGDIQDNIDSSCLSSAILPLYS